MRRPAEMDVGRTPSVGLATGVAAEFVAEDVALFLLVQEFHQAGIHHDERLVEPDRRCVHEGGLRDIQFGNGLPVQRLEDLEALRALKARYLNACDQQDPERAASNPGAGAWP